MDNKKTGVYPVYENQFNLAAVKEDATSIADMETFSVSFGNGVEEWKPFDQEGWTRRLLTAKSVTISVNGKRNVGDAGNDYIASLAFVNGRDAEGYLRWNFPDGTIVEFFNCVFNITNIWSGESTAVGPLEFEALSNGKPKVTFPDGTTNYDTDSSTTDSSTTDSSGVVEDDTDDEE